jgi:hypothetical protein
MARIKTILVQKSEKQVKVVPVPGWYLDLTIDVDAETALEGIRQHFLKRWKAKVHALQWVFPEDIFPPPRQELASFLVVLVEDIGKVPVESTHENAPSEELSPFLLAAVNPSACEPWSLPNWFHDLSTWIEIHFRATRQISQIRTCPNGAVVRIECREGSYYLKTQSSALAYESALLRILNQHMPGTCPPILPITPDLNTHITQAIEGHPVNAGDSPSDWSATLRDVARFQIGSLDSVKDLCNAGIPCRHHTLLETNLDEILCNAVSLQAKAPNGLTPSELRNLERLRTSMGPDFDTLNRCTLPASLIHGDLNQSNVLKGTSGRTVLIDWALSRITHPFFTLGSALFASTRRNLPGYEASCDAYLEPWCDFGSLDRLRAVLDAASRLFWLDSTIAICSLCQPGHVRNLINLPRFLRATLNAYRLSV